MTNFLSIPGRQILQRVVSAGGLSRSEPLYWRSLDYNSPGHVASDTYINLFHKKRWVKLTGLADFSLDIQAQTPGLVQVYSLTIGQTPICRLSHRLGPLELQAHLPLDYEGDFFFFQWAPDSADGPPPKAAYMAETRSDCRPVKIAFGVTSFERNDDLRLLVDTYLQARRDHSEICLLTELFIVNNQIADAPRLADLNGDGVTLVNNPHNTGGAGGFGLVARMAVEAGANAFTHVLFMDDDIIIDKEAWLRTLSLLRNLKPEYTGQIIGGGMFQRENPVRCHTLFEAMRENGSHLNVSGSRELTELTTIVETLEGGDVDWGSPGTAELPRSSLRPYAAWWYCVLPVELFRRYGFPLPFFFRGDDIELGLRVDRKVLWLNGICVWHPSFAGRGNALRSYLSFRNHLIACYLHFKGGRGLALNKYLRRLVNALARNDYERAALAIMSFTDSLSLVEQRWDGAATIRRVQDCLSVNLNHIVNLEGRRPEVAPPSGKNKLVSFFYHATVLLTLGGALVPSFLFRTGPTAKPDGRKPFPVRQACHQADDQTALEFNRSAALRLSLAGFKSLLVFMVRGHGVTRRLRRGMFE